MNEVLLFYNIELLQLTQYPENVCWSGFPVLDNQSLHYLLKIWFFFFFFFFDMEGCKMQNLFLCACVLYMHEFPPHRNSLEWSIQHVSEVTDGQVVGAGVSVTWNVWSWSGGHEFEPCSGRTWGAWYFCLKSYLNQNKNVNWHLGQSYT